MSYLPGLLTLHHSLNHPSPDPNITTPTSTSSPPNQGTKYPFVALYTSSFPPEGLKVLQSRGIPAQWVPSVKPASTRSYAQDPRFAETWNKLIIFSLEEYDRIILLDGDILVRRNMDELMELPLDDESERDGSRVFAAAHACACNPMKKAHYPANWFVLHSIRRLTLSPYWRQYSHRGKKKETIMLTSTLGFRPIALTRRNTILLPLRRARHRRRARGLGC